MNSTERQIYFGISVVRLFLDVSRENLTAPPLSMNKHLYIFLGVRWARGQTYGLFLASEASESMTEGRYGERLDKQEERHGSDSAPLSLRPHLSSSSPPPVS